MASEIIVHDAILFKIKRLKYVILLKNILKNIILNAINLCKKTQLFDRVILERVIDL